MLPTPFVLAVQADSRSSSLSSSTVTGTALPGDDGGLYRVERSCAPPALTAESALPDAVTTTNAFTIQLRYYKCAAHCRRCFSLTATYKLIFGLIDINPSEFFTVRVDDARRGHRYKLYLPGCKSAARYNFFSYRVVRAWNTVPAGKINFQSINGFKASLTNSLLIYQCRLNFA